MEFKPPVWKEGTPNKVLRREKSSSWLTEVGCGMGGLILAVFAYLSFSFNWSTGDILPIGFIVLLSIAWIGGKIRNSVKDDINFWRLNSSGSDLLRLDQEACDLANETIQLLDESKRASALTIIEKEMQKVHSNFEKALVIEANHFKNIHRSFARLPQNAEEIEWENCTIEMAKSVIAISQLRDTLLGPESIK